MIEKKRLMHSTHIITLNKRKALLKILLAVVFIVTFQGYLVAPLNHNLELDLHSSKRLMGFIIPAFALPYGLTSLFYSIVANKLGKRLTITVLTGLMACGLLLISLSTSGFGFIMARVLIGMAAGGIVPISISVLADLYPLDQRGKYFSWIVLALAGGMTFGPPLGAYLYNDIGWRLEFVFLAVLCVALFAGLNQQLDSFLTEKTRSTLDLYTLYRKCRMLLRKETGRKIYGFIFLNGIFHSGLFVWISYYFSVTYQFDNRATGLALLLFSLPGLLMAIAIATATERYGRTKIIFAGMFLISLTIGLLIIKAPFWISMLATGFLSVGYVMTQPLFIGIINSIKNGKTCAVTIALGTCLLFLGYGLGPIIFLYLIKLGIAQVITLLTILEICLALLSWSHVKIKVTHGRRVLVR